MKALEPYYRISRTAAIDIFVGADGPEISLCEIRVEGGRLHFEQKRPGLTNADHLKQYLVKGVPLAVNISGRSVLQKKLDAVEEITQEVFSKLYAGADSTEFYLQHFTTGAISFVSLIRRSEADQWLDRLRAMGFLPLSLSLGPFVADQVLPQLNFYGDEVAFDHYKIGLNARREWVSAEQDAGPGAGFEVKAENEVLPEQVIIPYAAAYQLALSGPQEMTCALVPELQAALESKLEEKKLKVHGLIFIGLVFTGLLISSVMLMHYTAQNSLLAARTQGLAENQTSQLEARQAYARKEAVLQGLGWDGGTDKSILIDQMFQLLPPELSLTELSVNRPLTAHPGAGKDPLFATRELRVRGESERILAVNEWIARLRQLSWVKEAVMEGYSYQAERRTGVFIIKINY